MSNLFRIVLSFLCLIGTFLPTLISAAVLWQNHSTFWEILALFVVYAWLITPVQVVFLMIGFIVFLMIWVTK